MPARSILVVDDQKEILDLTRKILENAEYSVVTASSGEEALRTVRKGAFDLVLLDINMPGMNGWETLRLLKADELLTLLPVVMFSVKSEVRDRVQGLQEGAVDYIPKPFREDDLLNRVRRVLESATRPAVRPAPAPPVP
jgi:DNA-binding response OmpR family regulator